MSKFRKLEYSEVVATIRSSSSKSAVYVGCDSKISGAYTVFGLVVVLHIDRSRGGIVFGEKTLVTRRMPMYERLLKEVELALESAFAINHAIEQRMMEIHLDINPDPQYRSNKIIKQAIAYVRAQGFSYKIKPAAWAASTAADYLISSW
jgi:uncharacterized protein